MFNKIVYKQKVVLATMSTGEQEYPLQLGGKYTSYYFVEIIKVP